MTLRWSLAGVTGIPWALSPQLALRLRVEAPAGARVVGGFVRAQVRVEPLARSYTEAEAVRLVPILGPRERWPEASRSFLWSIATLTLPSFEGATEVEVLLDCSLDVTAAASRYFAALDPEGRAAGAPLLVLFSGIVLHATVDGTMQVTPVPSDAECRGLVPLAVWLDLMARHHPDGGWLRVRLDLLERLERWRAASALGSSDDALETLLAKAGAP